MAKRITKAEWLAGIREAEELTAQAAGENAPDYGGMVAAIRGAPDDPGLTSHEIAAKARIPRRVASRRIRKLVAAGCLLKGTARRVDSVGKTQRVPVYRPAPKEKPDAR